MHLKVEISGWLFYVFRWKLSTLNGGNHQPWCLKVQITSGCLSGVFRWKSFNWNGGNHPPWCLKEDGLMFLNSHPEMLSTFKCKQNISEAQFSSILKCLKGLQIGNHWCLLDKMVNPTYSCCRGKKIKKTLFHRPLSS